jgi:PAS domain S-box-containing protein
MGFSAKGKIIGGFTSLLAILVLLGIYTYSNNQKSNEANLSVQHTNDILLQLGQVRNSFFDLETSQSSFLITKEKEYIKENLISRTAILASLDVLKELTVGNLVQQSRLDTLRNLLVTKNFLSDTLMQVDMPPIVLASSKIDQLHMQGLLLTNEAKEVIGRFRLYERNQRKLKMEEYDSYLKKSQMIIVCLFIFLFLSIAFVFGSVYYQLQVRLQSEQIIRQNWQTLQAILDNTSAYISIKDLDRRYTLVNKSFEFDASHPKEFYLGKKDEEVFSQEIGDSTKITDNKVLKEGISLQHTYELKLADGIHYYLVIKFPLRDVNQRIFAIGSISTDTTEQVALQEDRRKALENVSDLYHNAPCGYHSVDSEGWIVDMNDTQLRWLGYSRHEVIGKMKFRSFVKSEQRDHYTETIEQKQVHNVELYLTRKDGTLFPVLFNTEPIVNSQNNFLKTRTVVFDNTERKKQEDKIKQLNLDFEINNVLLKATNAELESFTYSVSHDLRAPLRSIHGYSQILMEDHYHQLNEEGKHTLEVIMKNAKKMGVLIDDLLDFSRMGRQELKKTRVDMQELIQNVLLDFPDHKAKLKMMNLPTIKVDKNLMKQVLINLVSNAIKYSQNEEQPLIEIGYREELMEDVFFVKDNGVGFDMQFSHKLFGVFQRLHREEEFDGTGVGLAFVHRIITKHGGKIWAESSLNEGAIFYFSLPRLDSFIYS